MIGVDAEGFFVGSDGLAVPALVVFDKVRKDMVEYRKDDLGYLSLRYDAPQVSLIEDGLAWEICPKPEDDPIKLVENIQLGIEISRQIAATTGYDVHIGPFVNFDPVHVNRPEIRILGCSPDRSIYGGGLRRPRQDPRRTFWRTGGAHIHFSIPGITEDMEMVFKLVTTCDSTLGVLDVVLDHSDLAKKRREMYGQPGKYRLQKWGVEYRTPSNSWLNQPLGFLEMAKQVHDFVGRGRALFIKDAPQAISMCDADLARVILYQAQQELNREYAL